MLSFCVFFVVNLNKLLEKPSSCLWVETFKVMKSCSFKFWAPSQYKDHFSCYMNSYYSAVIMRSNTAKYCINNCSNWGRISIRCWIHKRHAIPHPNGRAMVCLLLFLFWENWPRYNGTALYKDEMVAIQSYLCTCNGNLCTGKRTSLCWEFPLVLLE